MGYSKFYIVRVFQSIPSLHIRASKFFLYIYKQMIHRIKPSDEIYVAEFDWPHTVTVMKNNLWFDII